MCDNWKNDYSKEHKCEGVVLDAGQGEFVVRGKVETRSNNATIMFWAANPPTYCTSYSGSGLPYPNADIAYENTSNLKITTNNPISPKNINFLIYFLSSTTECINNK